MIKEEEHWYNSLSYESKVIALNKLKPHYDSMSEKITSSKMLPALKEYYLDIIDRAQDNHREIVFPMVSGKKLKRFPFYDDHYVRYFGNYLRILTLLSVCFPSRKKMERNAWD